MLMAITMVLPRPAARFRTAAPSARSRFVHRLLALRGRDPQAHFDATNQRRQFATDVSELEQKPRHLVSTDTSEEGEASLALPTGTLGLLACKTVAFMLYMQAANRVDPDRTAEDVAEGNLNKGTAWRPLCANSHVVQGHQSCGPSTASFVGDHVALDKSWWDTHFTASWVGVAQEGRHYTLATSSFLHANALHFGCNFLGLLCTASAVEHHLRSGLFMLAVYGSSAVAACTCQVGLYKLMSSTREKDKVAPDEHHHIEEGREQQTQRNPCESTFSDDNVNVAVEESNDMLEVRCLGASGGVCGLLGFLAAQQPAKRVYWFGCVPMPLWVPVATLFVADGSLALWKHYGARACSRTTSAPNRPGGLGRDQEHDHHRGTRFGEGFGLLGGELQQRENEILYSQIDSGSTRTSYHISHGAHASGTLFGMLFGWIALCV
ncbi:unnamed protein product [Amoebophrya sp. A120]|nr:unnamed protein product [Amoebophrya sp. A120]|eukprot:GSA120T00006470001.1